MARDERIATTLLVIDGDQLTKKGVTLLRPLVHARGTFTLVSGHPDKDHLHRDLGTSPNIDRGYASGKDEADLDLLMRAAGVLARDPAPREIVIASGDHVFCHLVRYARARNIDSKLAWIDDRTAAALRDAVRGRVLRARPSTTDGADPTTGADAVDGVEPRPAPGGPLVPPATPPPTAPAPRRRDGRDVSTSHATRDLGDVLRSALDGAGAPLPMDRLSCVLGPDGLAPYPYRRVADCIDEQADLVVERGRLAYVSWTDRDLDALAVCERILTDGGPILEREEFEQRVADARVDLAGHPSVDRLVRHHGRIVMTDDHAILLAAEQMAGRLTVALRRVGAYVRDRSGAAMTRTDIGRFVPHSVRAAAGFSTLDGLVTHLIDEGVDIAPPTDGSDARRRADIDLTDPGIDATPTDGRSSA